MDSNWFFSTLAQTTAAIVGLIGAITFSRLLQLYGTVKESKDKIIEDYLELRAEMRRVYKDLVANCNYLQNQISQAQAFLESEKQISDYSSQDIFARWEKGNANPVSVSNDYIERITSLLEYGRKMVAVFSDVLGMSDLNELSKIAKEINDVENTILTVMPESIVGYFNTLFITEKKVKVHQAKLIPKSILVLIAILAWLCISGIFLPLTYLSNPNSNLRDWYLVIFGVGIVALIGYFLTFCYEVIHLGKLTVTKD